MSVPALRFKEFSGDWIQNTIEDLDIKVIDGDRGTNYPNGNDFSNEGYCLFLNAKNVTKSGFFFDELSFISIEKDKQLRKGKLIRNDLVVTTRGTVGNIAYFDESVPYEHMRINSGMVIIRIESDSISSNYLYQYFYSPILIKNIDNIAFGSAQPQLTVKEINKIKISIPSLPEQTKIANFLTAVDQKISLLTQKATLLSQYKKGVMQQIFKQELRFKDDDGQEFPEWEEKTLGKIAQIVGGGTPDTGIADYWQGNIQWFTPTEIKTKYATNSIRTITESGLKNSSAKFLPIGTLLFSSRATVGDVSIALNECTTNQGFQSMIVSDNNNNEFVYYWISNNKKAFLEKASGSTFLEISKKEIEKLMVQCPCLMEQTKIANFLSAIDEKITTNQTQLDAVKQYKQGLLQQMFV